MLGLVVACSPTGVNSTGSTADPDWETTLRSLEACAPEDLVWVDAFKRARREERLTALLQVARDLQTSCAGSWAPAWLEARILLEQDQHQEAVLRFQAARTLAIETDNPAGLARSADQLGWISFASQSFDDGLMFFSEAIAAAIRADRGDLEGFARNNLAGLLVEEGSLSEASRQLEQAATALAAAGRPDAAIGLDYNRSALLLELGDAVAARNTLESVHRAAKAADDPWTLDAAAVVLGNLHLALREPGLAVDWYAQVSDRFDDLQSLARLGLGRAALAAGKNEEAVQLLESVATVAGREQQLFAGMAAVFLADAEMKLGRNQAAELRLAPWLETGKGDAPAEVAWATRWMLGRLRLRQGRFDDAVKRLREAVASLESQGATLDPLFEGLRFLRQRREPYIDLALALSESTGQPESKHAEILAVMSQAQARGLQRTLRDPTEAGVATLSRIQRGLSRDERILDFLVGEERGILLAIEPGSSGAFPIPGWRTIGGPISVLRKSLAEPTPDAMEISAEALRAANELAEALLDPAQDFLSEAQRVYIVPDGPLALLPFEVLPDATNGGEYLGQRLEIALLPVAGVPAIRAVEPAPLLLAGQPTFDDGGTFAELPWSAFELSKLRETWGAERTTLLVAGDLTLDRFEALDLAEFGTLHFATHAVASTVDPRRCGVIFSNEERLGLDRIVDLAIDDSLVVLSACRTGQGELIPGEGIVGLGWAFLRAGASGVVTSLWSVDDAVSARLMIAFHRRLAAGDDPVTALAVARRKVAAQKPHPAFWAPFVFVARPDGGKPASLQ